MSGHGRGDAAFDRWYQLHFDRIRILCARILRDSSAAEDMAQEALLRAWVRRDQMREEDLGAWLSVVARNLCLSSLRRDGRVRFTDEVPEHVDAQADPAAEVVRRESRRNVRRALAKLGDRNRRVIYLREVREAEYEEIGSEFGVSAEGARTIAFRARRVLKEHLAAVGEGFSGILISVRVRLRNTAVRTRSWMSAEFAPTMQAGMNLALALGVVVAGVGTVGASRAPSRLPIERVATVVVPEAPHRLSEPATPAVHVSNGIGAFGGRRRGADPLVPEAKITPFDPGDKKSQLGVTIMGETYWAYVDGVEGDGLDPAYRSIDATCETSPAVCEALGIEIET